MQNLLIVSDHLLVPSWDLASDAGLVISQDVSNELADTLSEHHIHAYICTIGNRARYDEFVAFHGDIFEMEYINHTLADYCLSSQEALFCDRRTNGLFTLPIHQCEPVESVGNVIGVSLRRITGSGYWKEVIILDEDKYSLFTLRYGNVLYPSDRGWQPLKAACIELQQEAINASNSK